MIFCWWICINIIKLMLLKVIRVIWKPTLRKLPGRSNNKVTLRNVHQLSFNCGLISRLYVVQCRCCSSICINSAPLISRIIEFNGQTHSNLSTKLWWYVWLFNHQCVFCSAWIPFILLIKASLQEMENWSTEENVHSNSTRWPA